MNVAAKSRQIDDWNYDAADVYGESENLRAHACRRNFDLLGLGFYLAGASVLIYAVACAVFLFYSRKSKNDIWDADSPYEAADRAVFLGR